MSELEHDVAEILREGLAKQPFDVLEHERARLNFPHRTRGLGEKISAITHRAVLATDGKWLTRWTTGNQVHAPVPSLKILIVNVAVDERPVTHEFISTPLVCADGFAGIVVVFEHGVMLETRIGRRDG